jgi:hypothetical protein
VRIEQPRHPRRVNRQHYDRLDALSLPKVRRGNGPPSLRLISASLVSDMVDIEISVDRTRSAPQGAMSYRAAVETCPPKVWTGSIPSVRTNGQA